MAASTSSSARSGMASKFFLSSMFSKYSSSAILLCLGHCTICRNIFPPFPYLCWVREYSATLVLFLRLYCSCLVVGSVIFHLVVYSSYELLFILLGVLFDHSN